MNKALTQNQLDHLLEFIGYGRLNADIWFIVMQENAASEEALRARSKFEQVEDLGKSFLHAGEGSPIGGLAGMSEIMLRLDGKTPTGEDLHTYQAEHLGRAHGATLICPVMPVPALLGDEALFNLLIPQYASQQVCYEEIKESRLELFQDLLEENRPKIVIGCGVEHWPVYQELFNQFTFSEHNSFLLGWNTDTVVILTDNLDTPEMHSKYAELVTLIKENALSIDTSVHTEAPIVSEAEIKRQKKAAARQAAAARRKPSAVHDPADPYCVCSYCLKYEGTE